MGKPLLILFFLIGCISSVDSQTLYGVTYNGGSNGGGTIGRVFPSINNLTVTKSLESYPANPYNAILIQANDGKLYGMSTNGGNGGYGAIFSFEPSTSTLTKLKSFKYSDGANPLGSLIQATDGKLYGMTTYGGPYGYGVIFSFDPVSSNYSMLLAFDSTNGANPSGSLVQATDGKLYGMTTRGEAHDNGVIFSFDPVSLVYTKLKNFDIIDNVNPFGSLIQASDGKLYGTTLRGGNHYKGTIFSLEPATSVYSTVFDCDELSGFNPDGGLLQTLDGKLCGIASMGGAHERGVIFSIDPASLSYTKLKDFEESDGFSPQGRLIQGTDGKVYGAAWGGNNSSGALFSLDLSSLAYEKLYDLADSTGSSPSGGLMQASNGKLYGLTSSGGREISSAGVVFSFDLLNKQYTVEKEFGINVTGTNISGGIMQGKDGKLYGMTTNGGSEGGGVIFSFDPYTVSYKKLSDFDGPNGSHPYGGLIQAADGKLYGMTASGGVRFDQFNMTNDEGIIFSYDPQASMFTNLMKFNTYHQKTGAHPYGSLTQTADGKLYGMNSSGGGGYRGSGSGVIFSFDPSSANFTRLKDFANFDPNTNGYFLDNLNGAYPFGNLLRASDGKLYGMTSQGGINDRGVFFSYDAVTANYSKLVEFDGVNGANPYGSLIQAKDGKLYGMTYGGGTTDAGVIFSFDPASATYSKLLDLDFANGAHPYGNLIQASDGKLYGMTSAGGNYEYGVVFSYDPSNSTYTKLIDYDGENGANPYFGAAFIEIPEAIPLLVDLLNFSGNNTGNINHLSWNVDNEQGVKYYELQRAIDAQNFEEISKIMAQGIAIYNYDDIISGSISQLYFYRLKIFDINDNYKYSKPIKIWLNTDQPVIAVNPNPVGDKLRVTVQSLERDNAIFILSDVSGRQLLRTSKPLIPGANLMHISEAGKLSSGTYLLTMITAKGRYTVKVVKSD